MRFRLSRMCCAVGGAVRSITTRRTANSLSSARMPARRTMTLASLAVYCSFAVRTGSSRNVGGIAGPYPADSSRSPEWSALVR